MKPRARLRSHVVARWFWDQPWKSPYSFANGRYPSFQYLSIEGEGEKKG